MDACSEDDLFSVTPVSGFKRVARLESQGWYSRVAGTLDKDGLGVPAIPELSCRSYASFSRSPPPSFGWDAMRASSAWASSQLC